MKKYRNLFSIILFVIFIITIQNKGLYSDFILDEEEKAIEKKPQEESEKLSKYVARNIKVEVIPNIKGAIRISWDLNKDSDDDFIVGRSASVSDTIEKALKSVSIKVVPSGANTEVIDSNLKAGSYYYCVLAKSKIMDKDIKLYAEQNYTINPAIIEADINREPEKILPQQVSLIYARIINNSQVRLTWRSIEARGIVYTIYRSNGLLDSPSKLAKAEKVNMITDGRESYTDNKINKSGTYFYAITTKDISGNEDLNLIPDQSYTTSGVYISLEVPAPVANISAKPANGGVKVSWAKTSSGVAEYLIYRYSGAITDSDRLSLAVFLGRVTDKETVYFDKNPGAGNYYYAVLTKYLNGNVLNDLVKGDNYTFEPVSLGSSISIISFTARAYGSDIELTWKTSGNLGSKSYKILRKESNIKSIDDLLDAEAVAFVNVDDYQYIDKNLKPGKYFYVIIPESIDEGKELSLEAGVNIVEKSIGKKEKETARIEQPAEKLELKEKLEPKIVELRVDVPKKIVLPKEAASALDPILRNYFLTGKYNYALYELENFVKKTNNQNDIAKARLYIGRSLIELKKYKEAVQYLGLKDVNDQYPKEARFWREFAVSKIPNGGNYINNDNFK
jgi:hypothetical protein